jgi:hypothetical protein
MARRAAQLAAQAVFGTVDPGCPRQSLASQQRLFRIEKRSWSGILMFVDRTGTLMTELQMMIGGRLAGTGRERGRA